MTLTTLIISLSLLFQFTLMLRIISSTCSRLSDSFLKWNGFIKVNRELHSATTNGQLSVLILVDLLAAFDMVYHLLLLEILFPLGDIIFSLFSPPLSFCLLSWLLLSIWHLSVGVSHDPVLLFSLSLLLDKLISFHPVASNIFCVLMTLRFFFLMESSHFLPPLGNSACGNSKWFQPLPESTWGG